MKRLPWRHWNTDGNFAKQIDPIHRASRGLEIPLRHRSYQLSSEAKRTRICRYSGSNRPAHTIGFRFLHCQFSRAIHWRAHHIYIQRARTNAGLIRGYSLFLEILRGFIAAPVLTFDAAAASTLDSLRSQGIRLGAMDLRIAAIALTHD